MDSPARPVKILGEDKYMDEWHEDNSEEVVTMTQKQWQQRKKLFI